MIACYLVLYEEGEVEYINGPTHSHSSWFAFKGQGLSMQLGIYRAAFAHTQAISGGHCLNFITNKL